MRYIDVTGKTEEEAVRKALEQLHLGRMTCPWRYWSVPRAVWHRQQPGQGAGALRAGRCGAWRSRRSRPRPPRQSPPKRRPPSKPVSPTEKRPAEKAYREKARGQARGKAGRAGCPSAAACDNDDARRITRILAGLLGHMGARRRSRCTRKRRTLQGHSGGRAWVRSLAAGGETLDAIQQLTNYAVNSGRDKRLRIHVDASTVPSGSRAWRAWPQKVAGKVLKYRRSVT